MRPSSHTLDIRSHTDADHRTVLSLTGDIDLQTAPHLRDQILEAAANGTTVVIDLRQVEFMDSPGLGTLVHCHRQLEDDGSKLVLHAPNVDVKALLDMTGLAEHFDIEQP